MRLHDLEGLAHGEVAARLDLSVLMSRRHLSDGANACARSSAITLP